MSTRLNMFQLPVAAVMVLFFVWALAALADANLSDSWIFTTAGNQIKGTIQLQQQGESLSGTWHTVLGKQENDTTLVGGIGGNTVYLTRTVGSKNQRYTLTLSADGNTMSGFGDGVDLNHTDLKLARSSWVKAQNSGESQANSGSASSTSSSAQSSPVAQEQNSSIAFFFVFFPVMMVIFALASEFMMSHAGWGRLAASFPSSSLSSGDWKGCWWLGLVSASGNLTKVGSYGERKVSLLQIGIPPMYMSSDSKGLYLKRNVWNFLHPALFVPWSHIQSVQEVPLSAWWTHTKPGIRGSRTVPSGPVIDAVSDFAGRLVEIQISEPPTSIYTNLDLLENARQYLGAKFKPTERA